MQRRKQVVAGEENGSTRDTGPVMGHTDMGAVDEFQAYLQARRPRMFLVEESDAMSFRVRKDSEDTYTDLFMSSSYH